MILSSLGPPPYDSALSKEHKSGRLSPVHPAGFPGDNVSYEMAMANGSKTPARNGKLSSGKGMQNSGYSIPPPDYEGNFNTILKNHFNSCCDRRALQIILYVYIILIFVPSVIREIRVPSAKNKNTYLRFEYDTKGSSSTNLSF